MKLYRTKMDFYQLLFKAYTQKVNPKLNWYENLFASFIGGVAKLIAKFLKIKGNTLVWNQLVSTNASDYALSNTTFTTSNTETTLTATSDATTIKCAMLKIDGGVALKQNHVYLAQGFVKADSEVNSYIVFASVSNSNRVSIQNATNAFVYGGMMWKPSVADDWFGLRLQNSVPSGSVATYKDVQLFDLTAMFGTTKAGEIYAMEQSQSGSGVAYFRSLFPLNYYSYGQKLLSFNGEGIKTVGFNQWDEEWEQGSIDTATGQPIPALTQIRSKNFIPVIENEYYYYKIGDTSTAYILCYDAGFNFIALARRTSNNSTNVANYECYLMTGTKYIKFRVNNEYGGTYKNDICINISSSENGKYEPYKSSTTSIPTLTYFPNGMMGWGTAFDELTNTKAIHRMNQVDLGTLPWNMSGSGATAFFYADTTSLNVAPTISAVGYQNYVCPKYSIVNVSSSATDTGIGFASATQLRVRDTTYQSASDFATAMSGVPLQFELATEQVVDIDPPLNLSYQVWEGGTEQLLPVNTDNPTTSPILADIEYPDGERDDQYFTYRQYLPNSQLLGMALNTLMGKNVPFNREALDILMKGE